MKEFDFIEFNRKIQADIQDAQSVISDIEHVELNRMYHNNHEFDYNAEHDFNKEHLTGILTLIKLKLDFAFEILGLEKMLVSFDNDFNKYENNLSELEFIPYVDVFYSPALLITKQYLYALTSHIHIEENKEFEHTNSTILLEQILKGTPKILTDRNVDPSNEADVRNEVYKVLIHVFPDTVREIPIAKVSKTYKPDIGIKKIKSAIEYKFVDSEQEAKTAIGGIFEDIQGYEGSEDWTTFYAVIYMTDHFLTPFQIEEEFKLSKVPHKWKPIIVFGKGHRKRKKI